MARLRAGLRRGVVIAAIAANGVICGRERTDQAALAQVAAAQAADSAQARPAWDTASGVAPARGNPLAGMSLDGLKATRDRPLFSPSRRPPPSAEPPPPVVRFTPPPPPPPPPAPPPSVALYGIVVGADGARAFISTKPGERIVGVRPGDDVEGWTVSAIDERRLVLSRAQESAAFTLFSEENAGRTGFPVSSQPAPILVPPKVRTR